MIKFRLLVFLIIISQPLSYIYADKGIKMANLQKHIQYLASDSLRGRKPGSKGGKLAAEYIKREFKESGLDLMADGGFQYFEVITKVKAGENNSIEFAQKPGKLFKDFIPVSFSANAELNANAVFAGYGLVVNEDSLKWDSYRDIDPTGKWVILLTESPVRSQRPNPFEAYSSNRQKVLTAKDKGAKGVIFVAGANSSKDDELGKIDYNEALTSVDIPVFQISRKYADKLLKKIDKKIVKIEKEINKDNKPIAFSIDIEILAMAEIIKERKTTQNIVAKISASDPAFKDEYIIIGGHYDHLGMGGEGSGSRRPDTSAIHNGADDNASGIATILELARILKNRQNELKRSILFVAFAAEEMGLIGSKEFVKASPVPVEKMKFMFNFDMIGRIDSVDKILTITGTGTAEELDNMIDKYSTDIDIKIKKSPEGYGPTDHSSFYVKDIPVLNFFGRAHEDYHTPFDDFEKIYFPGLYSINNFAVDLIMDITNRDKNFAFKEAGPKNPGGSRRAKLKATLGIMPDHTATDIKGLRAEVVIPGRPGAIAGLEKGDIITAIEGKPVNDIYDYMHRLAEYRPGDRISIDVKRNGKKIILIVQF